MKTISRLMLCLLACLLGGTAAAAENYSDTISFRFASAAEARQLIGDDDEFTAGWSEFDIVSRLNKAGGTKAELIAMKQAGVKEWTEAEKRTILDDMQEFNRIIRADGYRLPLPQEIVLVKSDMEDEGGAAGYTQANWIALSAGYMAAAGEKNRRDLLLHELSHILTRNSFAYKKRLYSALGFKVVEGGLEYPGELLRTRISNPDIAAYDSYGPFTVNGREENCAMYLYADREYTTGKFFEYVKVAFVPYGSDMKPRRDADGRLVVYHMDDISDFRERVGDNTNYIIHPEEILAENFVLAYLQTPGVATPALQQRVLKVLKGE